MTAEPFETDEIAIHEVVDHLPENVEKWQEHWEQTGLIAVRVHECLEISTGAMDCFGCEEVSKFGDPSQLKTWSFHAIFTTDWSHAVGNMELMCWPNARPTQCHLRRRPLVSKTRKWSCLTLPRVRTQPKFSRLKRRIMKLSLTLEQVGL